MEIGNFYFLTADYFNDFPDNYLMGNKQNIQGATHDRPCFYAIYDNSTSLYWLIPISSQLTKFKAIYQNKINRNGKCDTIAFAEVMGYEKAFLIQNMCPVILRYIKNVYIDNEANIPVTVPIPICSIFQVDNLP
ncbi:MAG: hypothetical protein K9L17_13045 [Clostridiales bacterium]|nr:hypothetical protein [Clostridiales bacterium]MCF8023605.1 hypothetical protein [Clostridiales bacterium]